MIGKRINGSPCLTYTEPGVRPVAAPAEGVLDYGVLRRPGYVTLAGLMFYEDTR